MTDRGNEHFIPLMIWLAISFALMATAFGGSFLPTNDFVDENNTTGAETSGDAGSDDGFFRSIADFVGLGGVVDATVTFAQGIGAFLQTVFAFLTFDIPCSDAGTELTKCPPTWIRWAFGTVVGAGLGFSIFQLIRG